MIPETTMARTASSALIESKLDLFRVMFVKVGKMWLIDERQSETPTRTAHFTLRWKAHRMLNRKLLQERVMSGKEKPGRVRNKSLGEGQAEEGEA